MPYCAQQLRRLFATCCTAVVLGGGCAANDSVPIADCPAGQFFESASDRCVTPADENEARALASRGELEALAQSGDPLTLVEITLATPIDHASFGKLLNDVRPELVEAISFYFSDVEGGTQVQVRTEGIDPDHDQLVAHSRPTVHDRYASFGELEIELVNAFDAAFQGEQEAYKAVRLQAKPSALLAAWSHTSAIAYIVIQGEAN